MNKKNERRDGLTELMADHVLANGLGDTSLRPLARAAGTSDRMLLYYFADKDELLSAVLERLADRFASRLEGEGESPQACELLLMSVWTQMREPDLWPYMLLWIDLIAKGARHGEPYQAIGGRIADRFQDWLADRLLVDEEAARDRTASRLLVTLDGLALMAAAGRDRSSDVFGS